MLDAFFMRARFEEASKNSQNGLSKWVRQADKRARRPALERANIADLCGVPIFGSRGAQVARSAAADSFEACPTKNSMKIRILSQSNICNHRIFAAPDCPKLMSGKNFTERLC